MPAIEVLESSIQTYNSADLCRILERLTSRFDLLTLRSVKAVCSKHRGLVPSGLGFGSHVRSIVQFPAVEDLRGKTRNVGMHTILNARKGSNSAFQTTSRSLLN